MPRFSNWHSVTNLSPSTAPQMKALPSETSIPPTPFILTSPPPSRIPDPARILAMRTSRKSLISRLTLSGSGMSSGAASRRSSAISSQWNGKALSDASAVADGRKGGVFVFGGRGGAGENDGEAFSSLKMTSREAEFSHGGGCMLARRWRLRRRASHKGSTARYGGWRGAVGPWHVRQQIRMIRLARTPCGPLVGFCVNPGESLTPSKSKPSKRWRGMTVTSSISLTNATSDGVKPVGSASAIRQRGRILFPNSNGLVETAIRFPASVCCVFALARLLVQDTLCSIALVLDTVCVTKSPVSNQPYSNL